MAVGSDNKGESQNQRTGADSPDAYLAARAQFAERRAYKRALRRARNPLNFSPRALFITLALVLLAALGTLALVYALRSQPAANSPSSVIQVVERATRGVEATADPWRQATALPAVEIILAPATARNLVLEGPPIPTIIITNTPVPLRVGVTAEVYGVGFDKLNIRSQPSLKSSQILFREDEGARFAIIGGPQEAEGFTWWRVRDTDLQVEGWAVANYLRAVSAESGQ